MTIGEMLATLAAFAAAHPERLGNPVVMSGRADQTWAVEGVSCGPSNSEVYAEVSLVEDVAALNRISDLECEVTELRTLLGEAHRTIASLEEIPTSTNNPIPSMGMEVMQ